MPKDPIKAAKAAHLWKTDERYREMSRIRKKRWYAKHKAENYAGLRAKYNKWYMDNIEAKRDYYLKYKYGISLAQLYELLEAQDNGCAICAKPILDYSDCRTDHCHKTGKVRGILCHGCNVGLGYFYENTTAMRNAADYIDKHNAG